MINRPPNDLFMQVIPTTNSLLIILSNNQSASNLRLYLKTAGKIFKMIQTTD